MPYSESVINSLLGDGHILCCHLALFLWIKSMCQIPSLHYTSCWWVTIHGLVGDHSWDGRWPSMAGVSWWKFCEFSLSAKFLVCITLSSGRFWWGLLLWWGAMSTPSPTWTVLSDWTGVWQKIEMKDDTVDIKVQNNGYHCTSVGKRNNHPNA